MAKCFVSCFFDSRCSFCFRECRFISENCVFVSEFRVFISQERSVPEFPVSISERVSASEYVVPVSECGSNLEIQVSAVLHHTYSITERSVPQLIPVLGSQPAGDVSHKPGGRLPLLSPGPQLPPQPLRVLLPISLLGEQRYDGCEQFA